jgi:hypothetical protein
MAGDLAEAERVLRHPARWVSGIQCTGAIGLSNSIASWMKISPWYRLYVGGVSNPSNRGIPNLSIYCDLQWIEERCLLKCSLQCDLNHPRNV